MRLVSAVVLLFFSTGISDAKPFIYYRSILNAASYAPQGLPNGWIARGSIFSIFGRGLGPAVGVSATSFPLGTALSGVSVDVCQGAVCVSALPLFVRADQVNAIMPSNAPLGTVSLRVNYQNEAGNNSPARVVAASFGAFSFNSGGFGPAIVQNFVSATELPINLPSAPARPGQIVILWGTGLGAGLNADNVAAQAGNLPVTVEIFIGGVSATPQYAGRSPCCSGVDQIAFEVPSSAPSGCYVPVTVRVNGAVVSNGTTIAIAPQGESCADPLNPLRTARGGKTGIVMLNRFHTSAYGLSFSNDLFAGFFQDEPAAPFHFNRLYSLPPAGSCATYSAHDGNLAPSTFASLVSNGTRLSAGTQIDVNNGSRSVNAVRLPWALDFHGQNLGTDRTFDPPWPLFFRDATPHRVTNPAGPNVGSFTLDLTPLPRLTWTNRDSLGLLNRGAPIEIAWSGGDPQGLVAIIGSGHAAKTQSGAAFLCVARTSQGRFTVPGYATASFPDPGVQTPNGSLAVIALPASPVAFQAAGLDRGFGIFTDGQIRSVDYR